MVVAMQVVIKLYERIKRALKMNKKGVSPIVGVILMIAITVIVAAVIANFVFGTSSSMKKTPTVQLVIKDDPRPISQATASQGVFIVRDVGGDKVPFDDLIVSVYDSNGNLLYSDVVSNANGTALTLQQISTTGYSNNFFEGGEQILLGNVTIGGTNQPGAYEVQIIYKPTGSPLADAVVSVT